MSTRCVEFEYIGREIDVGVSYLSFTGSQLVYVECNTWNENPQLTKISNGRKRDVRNGDAVRCLRTRFVLLRYGYKSLADLLSEEK